VPYLTHPIGTGWLDSSTHLPNYDGHLFDEQMRTSWDRPTLYVRLPGRKGEKKAKVDIPSGGQASSSPSSSSSRSLSVNTPLAVTTHTPTRSISPASAKKAKKLTLLSTNTTTPETPATPSASTSSASLATDSNPNRRKTSTKAEEAHNRAIAGNSRITSYLLRRARSPSPSPLPSILPGTTPSVRPGASTLSISFGTNPNDDENDDAFGEGVIGTLVPGIEV